MAGISPTCTGGCFTGSGLDLKILMACLRPAPFPWPVKIQLPAMSEAAPVARRIQVAALPTRPWPGSLTDGTVRTPVQVLHIPEQMQLFFELGDAGLAILSDDRRIELTVAIDPHGRHLADGRIEGRWLAAGGIFGIFDALGGCGNRPRKTTR